MAPLTVPAPALPPLGLGTWQWGDKLIWGYQGASQDADLRKTFDAAIDAGIRFFDTAEVYGSGRSEELLGRFIRESGQQVTVATKLFPKPWRLLRAGSVDRALNASLDRLGLARVDLYQVHMPLPLLPPTLWLDDLARAFHDGRIGAVGVSNYSASQMRAAHAALAQRGVPLASNQVEYSLLQRKPERNGVLAACQELGVTLIAYSPLAMGLLSGKYSQANPLTGVRGRTRASQMERLDPLMERMRQIGAAHEERTPSQVALAWLISKGAVPIPGAHTPEQAKSSAGALGWQLTGEDIAALEILSK